MARKRQNRLLIPEARQALDRLKCEVMQANESGDDQVCTTNPNDIKYTVAKQLNIPLSRGDNGELTTRQAGKIGGQLGGSMVRELVRLAQQQLMEQENHK